MTILQSGLHWKDLRRGLHQGGRGRFALYQEYTRSRSIVSHRNKSIYIIVLHKIIKSILLSVATETMLICPS